MNIEQLIIGNILEVYGPYLPTDLKDLQKEGVVLWAYNKLTNEYESGFIVFIGTNEQDTEIIVTLCESSEQRQFTVPFYIIGKSLVQAKILYHVFELNNILLEESNNDE